MKAEKFEHEVIGTSKTFYREQNLRVVIEGNVAKTDGNTVYLPAIDHESDVDLYKQRVMRGYIDHEAGHGRHTDSTAWAKSGHDVKRLQYAPILQNAFEDVRIEKLIIQEYPGAQKNLEAVNDAVNKHFLKTLKDMPELAKDFSRVGALGVTWEGRRRMGYDVDSNEECLKALDPIVRKQIEELTDLVEKCTSTADTVRLAVTIDRDIQEKSEASGGGAGKGGAPSSGKASGAAKGTGGGGGDSPDVNEGAGVDNTMLSADGSAGVSEAVGAADAHKRSGYRVWSWDRDNIWHVSDNAEKARHRQWKEVARDSGMTRYARARDAVDGAVNQMRRKLERALISKTNRGWLGNRESGLLDSKRLVAAYRGETNVHRVREPVEDTDVAVMLVIDQSGSMGGEKIRLAQQAAICYAEALDKTGIPFMIAGFTNQYTEREALNRLESARTSGYRNFPLDLYLYKKFDEPLKKAKPSIGAMTGCAMGDNADGDSLLQLYWRFVKPRQEKRKVMIVFSDGSPAASGGDQSKRLRNVISYLESEKVEMLAIGIMDMSVKRYYKKWSVVNEVTDLAKTALDQLARLLIDPKFSVDNRELMKVSEQVRK